MTDELEIPANISIVALLAKCPQLNPIENIWQFMRDNWRSNRVFTSHDTFSSTAARFGTAGSTSAWRIMTIGRRKWARQV